MSVSVLQYFSTRYSQLQSVNEIAQIVGKFLERSRHEFRLARPAAAHHVEPDRAKAGRQRPAHVGALVVADMENLMGRHAKRLHRGGEDLGARLGVADVHGVDRRREELSRAVLL